MSDLNTITKEKPEEWEPTISKMFDDIAVTYEKINTMISMGMDKGWRKLLLKRLGQYMPENRVLDVGCGPGSLSALAKTHLPKADFVSMDISIKMLEIAAGSGNSDKVVCASASSLPFKDGKFGAVVSAFVLRNLPDLEAFYKESHRILADNGVMVMLDLTKPSFAPISFFHGLYMKLALPMAAKIYGSKLEAYEYLDRSIHNCVSPQQMIEIMNRCGFEKLHVDRRCMGTVTVYTVRKS